MMAQYKTPNVYVKAESTVPASVMETVTAVPAFIGYTQLTEDKNDSGKSLLNVPMRVTNMSEYEAIFGGAYFEALVLSYDHANREFYVVEQETTALADYFLYQAVSHFFANGGTACWVVSAGGYGSDLGDGLTAFMTALNTIEKVDEVTLLALPESVRLADQAHYDLHNAALAQASKLQDRFAIVDVKQQKVLVGNVRDDAALMREKMQGDLKYGGAYYPYVRSNMARRYNEQTTLVTRANGNVVAMADLNNPTTADASIDDYNAVVSALRRHYLVLPPSGAVLGGIAFTDASRGVWKAPANVTLNEVFEPMVSIDNSQQESLNMDVTEGKSINAIRSFIGKGNVIWGARTLAGNDLEWRYVSVRRLFNMVEEALMKSTAFAVFEANSPLTWLKLKVMVQNYLRDLWQLGALMGNAESEAFFVRVGLGESMTEQDVLDGILRIKIGLAATRPAEFIELTFLHKALER